MLIIWLKYAFSDAWGLHCCWSNNWFVQRTVSLYINTCSQGEEKSIIKKATKFKRLNTKYTHHTLIYQGYKTILPIKIWVFCRYKVCICFPLYSDKTSNIEDQKKGDNCEAPITTIIGNFNNENNYWEF